MKLEVLKLYTDRDIFDFVMYYIYGQSGPSLLIESTDSMICIYIYYACMGINFYAVCFRCATYTLANTAESLTTS